MFLSPCCSLELWIWCAYADRVLLLAPFCKYENLRLRRTPLRYKFPVPCLWIIVWVVSTDSNLDWYLVPAIQSQEVVLRGQHCSICLPFHLTASLLASEKNRMSWTRVPSELWARGMTGLLLWSPVLSIAPHCKPCSSHTGGPSVPSCAQFIPSSKTLLPAFSWLIFLWAWPYCLSVLHASVGIAQVDFCWEVFSWYCSPAVFSSVHFLSCCIFWLVFSTFICIFVNCLYSYWDVQPGRSGLTCHIQCSVPRVAPHSKHLVNLLKMQMNIAVRGNMMGGVASDTYTHTEISLLAYQFRLYLRISA